MKTLQARFEVSVNGGGRLTAEIEAKISELESDIQGVADNWNKKNEQTGMKAEIVSM